MFSGPSTKLALNGAKVLHVIAEWPTAKKEHRHDLQKQGQLEIKCLLSPIIVSGIIIMF